MHIKDTGMRPIEVMSLRPRDIDVKEGLVYPCTAKHGSGRVLKLRSQTINMLISYLAKHPEIGLNERDIKMSVDVSNFVKMHSVRGGHSLMEVQRMISSRHSTLALSSTQVAEIEAKMVTANKNLNSLVEELCQTADQKV